MKFDVDQNEAKLIVDALAAQPFNLVYQLIFKLNAQIREQAPAPEQSPSEPAQTP